MLSHRNLITTEPHGVEIGTSFDDKSLIEGHNDVALTRIVVRHGSYIHSLIMHYNDGKPGTVHGGQGEKEAEVILQSNEFITTIEGNIATNVVATLKFSTNKGRIFGPYGRLETDSTIPNFVWNASENAPAHLARFRGLLYLSGWADPYIRQLRATFANYPMTEGTISRSDVNYEKQVPAEHTGDDVTLSNFARTLMSPAVTLVVGCDKVEFHASEATLCRIPFFRASLQGGFLEAVEKKIQFPDESPEILSALIEHLYNGTYTYTYDPEKTPVVDDNPRCDLPEGCFHVRVYAVAVKYDWQPLVDAALKNFLVVLKDLEGIDIVRLWKVGYLHGLTVPLCAKGGLIADFQSLLPKILKGLYETDAQEMERTVLEMPSLANDFMRLLVCD